ncbi:MAG: PQQ-binding-like beta-propeller repeat protein [Nevskiales bacterium]
MRLIGAPTPYPENTMPESHPRERCARPWIFLTLSGLLGLLAASAGAQDPAHGAPPPVTASRSAPAPSWGKPLPYPVVIADRRNNRLIEVAPDKRIIWQFGSPNLKIYHDNDDVYFSPDGHLLAISEEDNQDIHLIDYDRRELIWSYGVPDVAGSDPGYMNYPDDTHVMADGTILVADIRNCRVLFIDRDSAKIKTQWGGPSRKDGNWSKDPNCRHDPPQHLGLPNGVVELDGGDVLLTEITGAWITRLTRAGQVVWSMQAGGLQYPAAAMPARGEQVIVADFAKPGRVNVFDPKLRKVTWDYHPESGEGMLDHPSLAMELPNGDVILNDDHRHRVIVIDRQTKQIIWQYGITDHKGSGPGELNNPDGIDIDLYRDWRAVAAPASKP